MTGSRVGVDVGGCGVPVNEAVGEIVSTGVLAGVGELPTGVGLAQAVPTSIRTAHSRNRRFIRVVVTF